MFDRKPRARHLSLVSIAAFMPLVVVAFLLDPVATVADLQLNAVLLDVTIAAMLPALVWFAITQGVPRTRIRPRDAYILVAFAAVQLWFAALSGANGFHLPGSVGLWVGSLAAIVGQSAAEELLFRSLIPVVCCWIWTRRSRPPAWGFAISAALFIPWHVPPTFSEAVDHFLFAVLMTILLQVGKTVWLPIAAHVLTNSIALYFPSAPPSLAMVLIEYATLFTFLALAHRPFSARPSLGTRGADRLLRIDVLRAVALAVIFVENVLLYLPAEWGNASTSEAERLLRALIAITLEFRGLPLFALLLGFTLHAVLARPQVSWARLAARNWAFIALGTVHGLLLFSGDILFTFGVVLAVAVTILRRRWSLRWVIPVAGVIFALSAGVSGFGYDQTSGSTSLENVDGLDAMWLRIIEWAGSAVLLPLQLGLLFPIFVGFVIADRASEGASRGLIVSRTAGLACLGASIALAAPAGMDLLLNYGAGRSWVSVFLLQLAGIVGAIGIYVLVLQAKGRELPAPWAHLLAAVGRSTLTGYISSSAVFVMLLPAYGFWFARFGLWAALCVAAMTFCLYALAVSIRGNARSGLAEEFVARWSARSIASGDEDKRANLPGVTSSEGPSPSEERYEYPDHERQQH